MTILGIGVDVLHLPRLTRHLCDNRLARRILSPAELRDYLALPKEDLERRIRFLGVRYACLLRRPCSLFEQQQMGSKGGCLQGSISDRKTNLARFYIAKTRWKSQA
jgi:hypothetical protein